MTRPAFAPIGAAVLRICLGGILLVHGLTKVVVFTIPGTVGYFASLGLPAIAAYLAIFAELAGGAALILGFWTRLAAALLVPLLAGTIWVHAGNGFGFTSPGGGWEFPALLTAAAVAVAFQGGGIAQIGNLLQTRRSNRVFRR